MDAGLGVLNAIAKVAQLVVRGANLVVEVDRLLESQDFNELKTASVATRIGLLFLGITEMALAIANKSHSSGACVLKGIESCVHVANVPIQVMEAIPVLDSNAPTMEKVKIVEKKILGSIIPIIRSLSEISYLEQSGYLALSSEEQDKLQFPIYEGRGEYREIVGYKPFNKEECEKIVSNLKNCIPTMNAIEAGLELGVVSNVIGITLPAFNLLVARVMALAGNTPPPPSPPPAAAMPINRGGNQDDFQQAVTNSLNTAAPQRPIAVVAPQQEALDEDRINLRRFTFIPIELHEDHVFKQFVCSLTLMPIRFVAGDPTSGGAPIYYEKSAIQNWLKDHRTSPKTRKPLSISMLKSCVAAQAFINERLDAYSARIRTEIANQGWLPPNQERVDAILKQDRPKPKIPAKKPRSN